MTPRLPSDRAFDRNWDLFAAWFTPVSVVVDEVFG